MVYGDPPRTEEPMARSRKTAGWAWRPDALTERGIRRGNQRLASHKRSFDPTSHSTDQEETTMATKITTKSKAAKAAAAKKAPAKKAPAKKAPAKAAAATGSNVISLKELLKATSVDPKAARRKLRSAGITGHDSKARWEFTPTQAKEAKKVLGLK